MTEITGFYWVNVNHPDAEKWVRSYVRFFKSAGAGYLRIDYLRNFEDLYGTEIYANALRWISEEASNEILLSLVMPNCHKNCETEIKFGDMVRVSEDSQRGGWTSLSARQEVRANLPDGTFPDRKYIAVLKHREDGWPRFANAWDGFTHYARLVDRRKVILDGDFVRLSKFSNDVERETALSLYAMAGSPIAIADYCTNSCPSDIGSGEVLDLYRNSELLDLNRQGFVAKPLDERGERWVGQLPDGSWIVALFNRDEGSKEQTIDYEAELGVRGGAATRDLWRHRDVGFRTAFTVSLPPHGHVLLKIQPGAQGRSARRSHFDFNGDSKDDTGVFTPLSQWLVNRSTGIGVIGQLWSGAAGTWGEIPITGDFNGDSRTDTGVFTRESRWLINLSTGSGFSASDWSRRAAGTWGEIPITGDFNGDGRTDTGVFTPHEGKHWAINLSTGSGFRASDWNPGAQGLRGDIPITGDFNGDGRTDTGVFTPRDGERWLINLSTGSSFEGSNWSRGAAGTWGEVPLNAPAKVVFDQIMSR